VALCLAGLSSCTSSARLGQWAGPQVPVGASASQWSYLDKPAKCLNSPHYRIYTTLEDRQTLELLPQLLEGALSRYRQLVPDLPLSDRPMECYIFRSRTEWDAFTRHRTGPDATVYLQIRSGGYTVGDTFVSYFIGEQNTFSVCGHEGWHQFCGRHFKGRLPPFLEEGLACMFESVNWDGQLPRFNTSVNPYRASSIRRAIERNSLWPLEKLIATHAGDIVSQPMDRIDAFYGQSWAFARFLWEGENGRYRAAMQRWITQTAQGTVHDPSYSHTRAGLPWNRRAVKGIIEHYLQTDLATLDKAFSAYMRKIAFEELSAQYRS